jgi:hypothetical protein
MKHIISLVTCLIVFMAIAMAAGTTASAEACFSIVARAGFAPGEGVSETATTLAEPGTPMSGVDEIANEVGLINQVREEICPPEGP